VDLRNPAVVRALRLEGAVPRQVSRALLDGLPEAAEIRAPAVPRLGAPSPVSGYPVGTVLRVARAGAVEYYLAVADGVQAIGEVTADLIGFSQVGRGIVPVTPGVIGGVPVVDDVPAVGLPDRADIADDPVVCARWSWSDAAAAPETAVLVGDSAPFGPVVELAQADGAGPRVDRVVVPGGRCAFVRAAGVSGEGAATGTLYFVSDSGVVFGVDDEDAGSRLGLAKPVPAPWPVLAHLPRGPALSVDAASVRRDSVALPPSSAR
jgi:type VII secretion protein EccB